MIRYIKTIKKKLTTEKLPKWYKQDLAKYKAILTKKGLSSIKLNEFPQVNDKVAETGFDHHYVYQGPWVLDKLIRSKPHKHYDVGSLIGYLGFFSALVPTTFIDIRPCKADFPNFKELKGSIVKLPFKDKSIKSLSSLHVIEHVGLGRYGDPLDPLGSIKACYELQRVLAKGGNLYVSVPVGKEITYFNAHRVFDPSVFASYFSDLELVRFDLIEDGGAIVYNANFDAASKNDYACGLYWFKRK
jgi:hypothetical protein